MEHLAYEVLNLPVLAVKFLGIKLYDKDLWELILRFSFNLLVTAIIIRGIYFRYRKDSEYYFAYFMFSIIIFFVIFLLNNVKLSIGFAFGLFAVFAILRYRTATIPIREMTYLFVVITVALLNALANKKVTYAELLFTNLAIVSAIYLMEKANFRKQMMSMYVNYEKIENIKPQRHQELLKDLKERTGLDIVRLDILRVNFMTDTARIKIFYKSGSSSTFLTDNEVQDLNYDSEDNG